MKYQLQSHKTRNGDTPQYYVRKAAAKLRDTKKRKGIHDRSLLSRIDVGLVMLSGCVGLNLY